MSFRQFAFNNVRRNLRAYLAYLLSSAFMVTLFFTYAVFILHPAIRETDTGPRTAAGLAAASVIVYVFAFFFVLYSISAFLKSRNQEFGILTILGTSPGQLNRLIFTENMIVGVIAILAGLAGGFPLSFWFLGLSANTFGQDSLPMYLPVSAMILTVSAFLVLFAVVSVCTIAFLRRNQVLELLKGSSKPKKEPKVSILLSLFGIALLIIGFLSLWVFLTPLTILVAAASGIAGTYFFYSQLSVLTMRRLKRNRSRVWRGVHLLWISEMAYKLRDNARMLFLITVMTALASMSTGIILAIDQTNRQEFEARPFAYEYNAYEEAVSPQTPAAIREVLESEGIVYREIVSRQLYSRITLPDGADHYMQTFPLSVYNAMAEALDIPAAELAPGTALVIHTDEIETSPLVQGDTIGLIHEPEAAVTVNVQLHEQAASVTNPGGLLVLDDQTYAPVQEAMAKADGFVNYETYRYYVPEWNTGPPAGDAPELAVGALVDERLSESDEGSGYLYARGSEFMKVKQATMLYTFVGMFIALLFSVCSASFLYFKLHTDLAGDARMYQALSRIGLSAAEMRSSAVRQIAILFFVPIVVSAIQTMVVVKPFLSAIGIHVFFGPVLLASGVFLALQLLYFVVAQWLYVRALGKVMV
ncbi:FtsX-like permease family protein [Paenibacillus sp. 1P07SE]|uniref:FtsX-like permease family protein n=1 Tax=Paenibacillus sp. 1P07SE TaxID=3132209 RepID=UPI0039A4599E